ncbi:MAG: class II fructose-bisphosphate aldolase, partial [Candidatus Aenigmarchaeota archaeon]|nr:class II fructose-bisphosphate aldolase [Candidatus Aenigmarchaeota archaeon]
MLVYSNQLIKKAMKKRYAVGGFNIFNIESTIAVIEASEKLKSPALVQMSESTLTKYFKPEQIVPSVISMIKKSKSKLALHLDHGKSLEVVKIAIKNGFTSIMFDGSLFPFEKNIKLTKKAVKIAKKKDERITVEGEIGIIGRNKSEKNNMTDPEDAKIFAEETGVDMLAISIGNAHGLYKGKPNLDFKRLKKIRRMVKIPLVLHGGSGIPDDQIKRAIKLGISKINIFTEAKLAFYNGIKNNMKNTDD